MQRRSLLAIRFTTLIPALFLGVSLTQAQAPTQTGRLVSVSVVDPLNRFVTGLDQDVFEIVENGVRRPVTEFSSADSPITVAVAAESSVPVPGDVLRAQSVNDAVRQLMASTNPRKALIITPAITTAPVPAGIVVFQSSPENLSRSVVEARNQYILRITSENSAANLDVVVRQPRGLPVLRAVVNAK